MPHLALTVHRRGEAAQTALLAALAPTLLALEEGGALGGVWATRFDARGPHVFLLLAAEREGEVRAAVASAVAAHLAAVPPAEPPDEETLLRRHEACRGSVLAPAHRLPGLAPADSWVLEPQEPLGYPFYLLEGMDPLATAAFLRAASARFHWAVERAAAGAATAAALLWIAALDRELEARGAAGDAWAYHTGTLLPGLGERAARGEALLPVLERGVTPANRARFDAAWEAEDPGAARLARELVGTLHGPGVPGGARLPALREAVHSTLHLLGLPVVHQIPLFLHVWSRALRPGGAA